MPWTIKGENGATLDAVERTFESLNITRPTLTLASLASDVFEWTASSEDAKGTGTIIPDTGQRIEVFHNGTRRFFGHVTKPRVRSGSVNVRAEGPWWWLQRLSLTSDVADGNGDTAERVNYVLPTQSLKTSIEAVLERAIENGAPIQVGTVAEIYSFPRITFDNMAISQALAELMRACPDAVGFFDYTVEGFPAFSVARRSSMEEEIFTLGESPVEDLDIAPRLDLEVSRVLVNGANRDASTGKVSWVTESQGTAVPGKTQIMVVSGPELQDTVPTNDFAQVNLETQTSANVPNDSDLDAYLEAKDANLASLISTYGIAAYLDPARAGEFKVATTNAGGPGYWSRTLDGPTLTTEGDPSGLFLVISDDAVPDWLSEVNGLTVVKGTLRGDMVYARKSYTAPSEWDDVSSRAWAFYQGYEWGTTSFSGYWQWTAFLEYSVPVTLISQVYADPTTVLRSWDYDYVQPPEGLAQGLLDAQSWIPWEGKIQTVEDAPDGAQALNRKYQVRNALPECATMGALARQVSFDLNRGRRTIELGPPARVNFGTLTDRLRRAPKDNIEYL